MEAYYSRAEESIFEGQIGFQDEKSASKDGFLEGNSENLRLEMLKGIHIFFLDHSSMVPIWKTNKFR